MLLNFQNNICSLKIIKFFGLGGEEKMVGSNERTLFAFLMDCSSIELEAPVSKGLKKTD